MLRILNNNMCKIRKNRWRVDLTDQKFGRLKCIERSHKKGKHFTWKCECECGNICYPYQTHIIRGNTKSCGCLNTVSGKDHRDWKGHGEISGNVWSAIKRDRRKAMERKFSITIEEAWELFIKQERKCALSGLDLTFDQNGSDRTASLDRIDSSIGYVGGNVQWVHKHVNIMKNIYDQNYFIEICKLITSTSGGQCEL